MTDPTTPAHWMAPLNYPGFEPTALHVHPLDGGPASPLITANSDAVAMCPPCLGDCNQGRTCPARVDDEKPISRWHDSSTHPAEWLMLAIAAGLLVWAVLAAIGQRGAA